jgi:RNA polymerase sporulation-specific sigma factor
MDLEAPYNSLPDSTLLSLLKAGDLLAERILYDRYKSTVRSLTRAFFLRGGEMEDLSQEGMIGLYHAVRNFDASKGTSFKTFAELCIRRQLITAVTLYNRKKHQPLNNALSLEQSSFSDESGMSGEGFLYERFSITDPEQEILSTEHTQVLNQFLEEKLSKLEKQILNLFLSGLSYEEIALSLNKTVKSINNALSRVRQKAKMLKEFSE